MTRATEADVEALHGLLVGTFKDILENGETHVDKEGEVHKLAPKPATLSVIRAFLSDNGIEASPNATREDLLENMPFKLDDQGENVVAFTEGKP